MTVSLADLGFYAVAVALLWLTPGPVWVALTARTLAGGFRSAWPLAVGVTLGDLLWPFCAILGVTWVLSVWGGFLAALKWVAAGTFVLMGALVIRGAGRPLGADSRLTRPGMWAGFGAGVLAILGNPKAILFYMGMLPGFFDVTRLGGPDIAAILLVSGTIPLLGNLGLALVVDRARTLLSSPGAVRRTTFAAGGLLVGVGLLIPFL
ncbi:LysE family translocator [Rubellimicrobium aerolatum]|uniref:LysE family translocator n=1 Tax=Rubellimicrobium aerolatum TaxID=490979 RepID=A0ABW0S9R5_9RHOB|nr:LysE family transporter [Rubellimicrobium aerolatum]MBP1805047.1 threonine/homoserine/homoserine lactone efflux protein [Rubellimicrobium aerolatum]